MGKLSLIIIPFLLGGCLLTGGPSPITIDQDVPGPPEYKQGWRHGCESGFATYGPVHYKFAYSFYQDFNMLDDRYYNAAWHEAFNFCRHYSLKWHTHDLTKN